MRQFGFLSVIVGFVLLATGYAQAQHIVTATSLPESLLMAVGAVLLLGGILLTAIAGRFSTISSAAPKADAAPVVKPTVSVMFTTKKTFRIGSDGTSPAGTSTSLDDAMTAGILRSVLARLSDPSAATEIQIKGGDPAQIKEQLQRILGTTALGGADAAAAGTADSTLDQQTQRLRELDDLHAAGVVDDGQYQALRAKVLGQSTQPS